jgi:hypothetical protein
MINLFGVNINSNNVTTNSDSDFFEYTWQGRTKKHHFKKIKKRVRFSDKMSKTPKDIVISDLVLKNCSNLHIVNINKKGFSIQFTGIKALENEISFNWKTV